MYLRQISLGLLTNLKRSANNTQEVGTQILVVGKVPCFAHLQLTLEAHIPINLCPTTRNQEILGDLSVLVEDHRADFYLFICPPSQHVYASHTAFRLRS